MKSLLVALTAFLTMSAVVPADAQSQTRKQCWYLTDSSRLTGFYDVCTDTKVLEEVRARQLTIRTLIDSPRDSGNEAGGGGGGGQR